jgi:hypothetical protein
LQASSAISEKMFRPLKIMLQNPEEFPKEEGTSKKKVLESTFSCMREEQAHIQNLSASGRMQNSEA